MRGYSLRRLAWAGPLSSAIAAVANLLYYRITQALGETYQLPLDAAGTRLAPMPVLLPVLGALAAGLLATLFFGLLIRFARKPATVFLSVALTALILSFGGTFGVPAATDQTKLLLSGMNTLTAVIIVGGLLMLGRDTTSDSH
jgi:hypothetical protein